MKKVFNIVFIISCISTICCQPQVDNYYVDCIKGNDENSGTLTKPIKTISELNKRIQKKPLSVFFTAGQTFEGTVLLKDISGTESRPVIISSTGSGRATINGGNKEAISAENCRFLQIINLNIKGSGRKDGNTSNGLSLVSSGNCIITAINAGGFQKSGVDLLNCKAIEVREVEARDNGFCGINVMGTKRNLSRNILIKDCKAENNPGDPTILDNHSGNGILVGVSDSVLIDHCTATNNGWDMPRIGNGPVGIWTWESNRVTIQYCISYYNKTSKNAKDGGGFDLDGGVTNSIIQYCLSYGNQGAGYGLFQYSGASDWANNIVRYCVSINDATTTKGSGSFFIWNGSSVPGQLANCQIYNNVAYNSVAPVISYESASSHEKFTFCNNIFIGSGNVISGHNEGSLFIGNIWWGSGKSLKFMEFSNLNEWSKKTGQEMLDGKAAGIQTDPLLKGPFLTDITDPYKLNTLVGYTLQPGSPLRNRGIDIKKYFGIKEEITDFYNNPVPSGIGQEPGIQEIK
jgi:hypothetical protein